MLNHSFNIKEDCFNDYKTSNGSFYINSDVDGEAVINNDSECQILTSGRFNFKELGIRK